MYCCDLFSVVVMERTLYMDALYTLAVLEAIQASVS